MRNLSSMQCEAVGALTYDDHCARNLGLGHLDLPQRKLISGMVLSKPVSPQEATLIMLGLPLVMSSEKVTFINDTLPSEKRVLVSKPEHMSGTTPPLTSTWHALPPKKHTLSIHTFNIFRLRRSYASLSTGATPLHTRKANWASSSFHARVLSVSRILTHVSFSCTNCTAFHLLCFNSSLFHSSYLPFHSAQPGEFLLPSCCCTQAL